MKFSESVIKFIKSNLKFIITLTISIIVLGFVIVTYFSTKKAPNLFLEAQAPPSLKREISIEFYLKNAGDANANNVKIVFPPLDQANMEISSKKYGTTGKGGTVTVDLGDRIIHPGEGSPDPDIEIKIGASTKKELKEVTIPYIINCKEGEFHERIAIKDLFYYGL